jgi:hypothetical protein
MLMLTGTNYNYLASCHRAGDMSLSQYNLYNRCASKVAPLGQNQVGYYRVLPGTTGYYPNLPQCMDVPFL